VDGRATFTPTAIASISTVAVPSCSRSSHPLLRQTASRAQSASRSPCFSICGQAARRGVSRPPHWGSDIPAACLVRFSRGPWGWSLRADLRLRRTRRGGQSRRWRFASCYHLWARGAAIVALGGRRRRPCAARGPSMEKGDSTSPVDVGDGVPAEGRQSRRPGNAERARPLRIRAPGTCGKVCNPRDACAFVSGTVKNGWEAPPAWTISSAWHDVPPPPARLFLRKNGPKTAVGTTRGARRGVLGLGRGDCALEAASRSPAVRSVD